MPKITLTDFVDIVSKSGTPKATKVAQVKNRPAYDPKTDFYKKVREAIVDTHQRGASKADLSAALSNLKDTKKQVNYPDVLQGYKKWWGKKTLSWFVPPSGTFTAHGVDVSINPELGLEINGTKHIIKLYFKGEGLAKNRANIVTCLMGIQLNAAAPAGAIMSVLDVRNAKLVSAANTPSPTFSAALTAELAYIAALWPNV